MRRLIYISRSLIGSDPGQIASIVDQSIVRNQAAGLTGILWSDGSHFAQAIEGSSRTVEETMKRIRSDRRHVDVELVSDQAVAHRVFGSWSMIWSNGCLETLSETAFIVGFARTQQNASARRLYEIVVASEG